VVSWRLDADREWHRQRSNKIIDQFSALEILEDKRALLEQIAREKYDTKGTHPADGLYEGKPILRIYPEDLQSEQRKPG
jgi:hypothetical protein